MKTLLIDILLYHPEHGEETRATVRVPVSERTARRLLRSQKDGLILSDSCALYNLASAIAHLNGKRGIPLGVREVDA